MKNKAYDLEFWRKPGESDAETRERVYKYFTEDGANVYAEIGLTGLLRDLEDTILGNILDNILNAIGWFFEKAPQAIAFVLLSPFMVLSAPFYIIRSMIRRYIILLRIGAITWYGKRTEKVAPNRFKPGDIIYAKICDNYEVGFFLIAKVKVLGVDNNVQILDDVNSLGLRINSMETHLVNNWNMWATIEEAEQATGLEYKFKTKNLLFNE